MAHQNVLTEKSDGIGLITINREDVRNAIDPQTYSEIIEAMETFASDEEVGVIIITGAGDKSFAAGSDIRQIRELMRRPQKMSPTQNLAAKAKRLNGKH